MDFDAAEVFLKQARAAHEAGDETVFKAARKMIAVALEIPDPYDPRRVPSPNPVAEHKGRARAG